jgi:hypothetical protein
MCILYYAFWCVFFLLMVTLSTLLYNFLIIRITKILGKDSHRHIFEIKFWSLYSIKVKRSYC